MANGPIHLAGGITATPLQSLLDDDRKAAQDTQSQVIVTGLAGYVKQAFESARMARLNLVDNRLLEATRARRGEYEPDKLMAIRATGGSDVYAMLTSVKCRAAGSWIRDVVGGQGDDRPWDIKPTPTPDTPPEVHDQILAHIVKPIAAAIQMGTPMTDVDVQQLMSQMKDAAQNELREDASLRAQRMADKMETQLDMGGFNKALSEFIDDLVTYPAAILKGPVVRRKKALKWGPPGPDGTSQPIVTDELKMEWERVSPFDIYPSASAETVEDGYLCERHKLSRQDLNDLIGVDGYDAASIRMVLDRYFVNGHQEFYINDLAQNDAQGKSTLAVAQNPDGLIDAVQYWGSVAGKMLLDWGMSSQDIQDPTQEYHVEVWMVAEVCIKAVLNYDPLHRKPYYKASYENIAGNWWGNGVYDLVKDAQVVVNAAARAIVNNTSMASGPQVGINVDRLPPGETLTTLTPWKVWMFKDDPAGGGAAGPPITFFQPESYVQELMQVFEKFSELADEYSGIPRYMTGDSSGGAGRTASGLSMLVGNAAKAIKQVIANIDQHVTQPLLERLYLYNMLYSNDPDLKGDVQIVAGGTQALLQKEAAQQRRNEFLAATMNPVDMQIIGLKGRAAILREQIKTLDMDPDDIIPPPEILKVKQLAMEAMQAQQAAGQGPQGGPSPGSPQGLPPGPASPMPAAPQQFSPPGGTPAGSPVIEGQQLSTGQPVTDHFGPKKTP